MAFPDQCVEEGRPEVESCGELEKRYLELEVVPLWVTRNRKESDVAPSPQDVNVNDRHRVRRAAIADNPRRRLRADARQLQEQVSQGEIGVLGINVPNRL